MWLIFHFTTQSAMDDWGGAAGPTGITDITVSRYWYSVPREPADLLTTPGAIDLQTGEEDGVVGQDRTSSNGRPSFGRRCQVAFGTNHVVVPSPQALPNTHHIGAKTP